MIEIKDISGKTKLSIAINEGAKGKFTLMKEDYIILPFSVSEPVQFKLGDYVDLAGVLDESLGGKLAKIYEITDIQKPTYNTSTGGYDYELQMNAYYWKWKNKIFKYTPEHAGSEASWSLTAALDVQLGVFLRNLKALGYTYRGTDFTFSIDSTVENKAVAMTYDNMNLLDALFSMAGEDKWNCDCWITDNVIHFGRCEFGDSVKIERGVEASSITRSESQGTYATRIYAFGSTKNIPTNYRPTDEQAVVNGVVQKRLMLPSDTPYIDAYEGMSQEEAIEDVVVFDDVYPRRVGTLSDVHTRTEEVENEDGTTETVTYYRYKDTGLEFKEEYIIEGQELQITFQSGKLNGMVFGVIFNPSPKDETRGEQLWEIVRNENYGRLLPDDMMYPADGDEYILSGFDIQLVSDQYIPAAERELKEKALKYADKVKKDDGTYPTTLASNWVHEDPISRTFEFGQRINLVDDTYFENGRISRVLGWEMNLDIPWDSPVYTIGESMPYSRIGEIEDKVDSLTYKGQTYTGGGGSGVYVIRTNDSTAPSDSNVFSALRSLATFLRKNQPDQTEFLVKFLKGIELGKYTTGLLGTGGAVLIDENGNSHAEFDYLNIRKKALFTEITVQELKHIGGALIISPAAMIISSVEETEEGYKCYFDKKNSDGKTIYNEFEPGDQGRCQTFNLEKQENGQVGNRYWWRLVVATGDDYVVFSKTDADIESDIPAAGDEVAQLGNRTDKTRQNAQIYSAYGSDSPSRKMYQGIDSYNLVGKIIKDEYFDVTTGRFKEVTYGDAYYGDPERKSYFDHTVDEGVEVKGKVHIESGSDGWENLAGLSGAFDDAYKDINTAKDAADKAQSAANEAKEDAKDASDRLDEWASDGVISPTEKLSLKQEIENLQAEYETNLKNAEKYGIDFSLYKSKWEAYKAELEYHSADTPENIPIRDSFRTNQSAFYTSRTELLTAIADATKEYADKLVSSISVGAENLLLNTGFTGNYEDEKLTSSYKLTPTSLLYSDRMFTWEGKSEIIEDKDSASGFSAVIGNLSQNVSTLPDENYVVSYKAKGNSVTVNFGGSSYKQQLTSSYVRYVHRFTSGSSSFSISGDATVCELKLERGTVATDWCPSRKDRNEVADRFKYFWYLQDALQSATQVNGGLVLTTMIMLGKFVDGILQKVNAGISGIYNDDTDVAVWAGGTYEDAIRTVQTLIANPNYQPSEQEWKSMAKFVATHGGDTFIRGYIYALGGIFRGIIYAQGGEFGGYLKTTFKDLYESDAVKGTYSVKIDDDTSKNVSGYKLGDDLNISTSYAHDIIVLPNDSKYIGTHVNISNANVPPYSRITLGYYTEIYSGSYPYGIGGGYIEPSEKTESEYIRKLQGGMMQFIGVPKEVSGTMYTQWICLTTQVKSDDEYQESLELRNASGSLVISPDDIHFTFGATADKGYTGEVLVQEAELAADRIYLTFKNGIMVGTRKGG